MENVGIILEGGAMRSMFSAGVLDFFLDNEIQIPNVIAVSAGAYAGMNYVLAKRFTISTANCLTGEAAYYDRFEDEDNLFKICRAANSMPFIVKITETGGRHPESTAS